MMSFFKGQNMSHCITCDSYDWLPSSPLSPTCHNGTSYLRFYTGSQTLMEDWIKGKWNENSNLGVSWRYRPGSLKISKRIEQITVILDLDGIRMALNQQMITYTFAFINQNANHHLGIGCFVHKGTISVVKRVDMVD
jgi:hypothetical protein